MSNADTLQVIRSRRAVFPKQMNGAEVPDTILNEALEAANWAPTHRRTEPWRFKVYSKEAKNSLLDQCKECYVRSTPSEQFNRAKVEKIELRKTQVSHVVAICMKRHEVVPEWEEIAATAMAVQNLWLSLSATKKYGGYWSTPAYAMGDDFSAFLRLAEDERCLGLFYIGQIDDKLNLPSGVRDNWKEKVTFF